VARLRGKDQLSHEVESVTGSERTPITWHKSSASGHNGNCVEVAFVDDSILVRNSRHPLGCVLSFTHTEWKAFLAGVNNGRFMPDRPAPAPPTFEPGRVREQTANWPAGSRSLDQSRGADERECRPGRDRRAGR
jgi:hypothetical protein